MGGDTAAFPHACMSAMAHPGYKSNLTPRCLKIIPPCSNNTMAHLHFVGNAAEARRQLHERRERVLPLDGAQAGPPQHRREQRHHVGGAGADALLALQDVAPRVRQQQLPELACMLM